MGPTALRTLLLMPESLGLAPGTTAPAGSRTSTKCMFMVRSLFRKEENKIWKQTLAFQGRKEKETETITPEALVLCPAEATEQRGRRPEDRASPVPSSPGLPGLCRGRREQLGEISSAISCQPVFK